MKALCLALLAVFVLAGAARAQDVDQGRLLYDTYCVSCHREGLHDRQNSKVATYADLRFQVERWTQQSGHRFTLAEREDLIEYLDAVHYRLAGREDRRPR